MVEHCGEAHGKLCSDIENLKEIYKDHLERIEAPQWHAIEKMNKWILGLLTAVVLAIVASIVSRYETANSHEHDQRALAKKVAEEIAKAWEESAAQP